MNARSRFLEKLASRQLQLTFLGLGHVGLPTALVFSKAGFKVTGIDIDATKIEALRQSKSPGIEPRLQAMLDECLRNQRIRFSSDSSGAILAADVVSICVPTPVSGDTPNMGIFQEAFATVVKEAHKEMLISIESTVPPSTTSRIAAFTLRELGYQVDNDIYLAYCPERLAPGNAVEEFSQNTRIIGGAGPNSGDRAAALYKTVCRNVIVTDSLTAELSKLAENTFRDINIAYANLLALVSQQHGADSNEVIALANTHPRVRIHQPGLGVGGPCLPKDPFMLVMGMDENVRCLVENARQLNNSMVSHAVKAIVKALKNHGTSVAQARIAVLGISYKPETEDVTYSPSKPLISELMRLGASVVTYDPYTTESFGATRAFSLDDAVEGTHCIILATAHATFKSLDPKRMMQLCRSLQVVFDGPRALEAEPLQALGLTYLGTGHGIKSDNMR